MPNYEKCFIKHMCCSDSLCSDCQEKIEHILVSYKQKEQEVQELKDKIQNYETTLKFSNQSTQNWINQFNLGAKEIEKLQKEKEELKEVKDEDNKTIVKYRKEIEKLQKED